VSDTIEVPREALAALIRHACADYPRLERSWSITFTADEMHGDGIGWAGPSDDGAYTFALVLPERPKWLDPEPDHTETELDQVTTEMYADLRADLEQNGHGL